MYEFNVNTPYPGKEEYVDSEKYEIKHWDWEAETRTREVITRLNRIRHDNPALQNTWNVHFADVENENIICYGKVDEASGNVMIMAVNMDPYHAHSTFLRLPLEELGLAGTGPSTCTTC